MTDIQEDAVERARFNLHANMHGGPLHAVAFKLTALALLETDAYHAKVLAIMANEVRQAAQTYEKSPE
jgi:hypothetical protein